MRKLAMVAMAVLCMAGTASVASAQGGGGGGGRGRGNVIDRLLTQPTAITLTADQQKTVDSLKAALTEENTKMRDEMQNGGDRTAMFGKMQEINKKYETAVRAILTPDQQKTFDENVAAQPQRGRRGGGGGR